MSENTFLTCTLLGKLAQHGIIYDGEKVEVETVWVSEVHSLEKVSAMAVSDDWIAIAGFGKDEKGLVEVWSTTQSPDPVSREDVDAAIRARLEQLSMSESSNQA